MSEITVKNKRLFDKNGNLVADRAAEGEAAEKAEGQSEKAESPPQPEPKAQEEPKEAKKKDPALDLGGLPVTIAILFLDLASNALIQMGEKGPEGQALSAPNLPVAKQLIDLLGVLEKKTQGNLDHEEEALLKALLYDVRLKYVSLTSS
ncbi:MAG: DUF1844 domain-containing protein [Deltaproteobacteria bacterium]|jgi:hypothetical protein|nr:DUF1844 domain-containing protein [Deltaproteobacteria bacterium]